MTTAFGVPFDVERMDKAPRIVPAFAGDDLEGEMQALGYSKGQWNPTGWPMLTYTISPREASLQVVLEHFRELGMDVEGVLSRANTKKG